ncbi:MAG: AEC family transporter [Ruminococcus sp.]|uniref:AEC family transporter n=1 Tax=Ruminococcus sp. TaxID=41978 RepID=UPI0028734716|nr:AEC family transporter [Ruminococcus sp.]MBQ3284235.1 AEC family transporter [Ruminococcus sp.]
MQSFFDVGTQVLVLFILIGVGALLTKVGLITEQGSRSMTDVVLYAVTPCVIVNAFQREYQPEMLSGLLIALLAAFLSLLFSVLLAEILYRKKDIDRGVVLKFSVVFSNCGFMALPLQKAILGEDGVFYGAAFVAMFNIFMWTYGLITMSRKKDFKDALKAVVNPGIIGTVIGLILFACSIKLPTVIATPVSMLAALNTPVPMLVIGYHLMHSDLRRVLKDKDAYIAMALRLIVLPLAVMGVMLALKVDATVTTATVIAVSAPVAAFTTMMATKYGRDTELSAGIVSASSLFSLITMPLVVGLTQYLASM